MMPSVQSVVGQFLSQWLLIEGPFRIVAYEQMLYPQYEKHFQKTLPRQVHAWLVDQAQTKVAGGGMAREVREHMMEIAEEKLPFGWAIDTTEDS